MPRILVYIFIYFFVYKNLALYPSAFCSYYNLFALICCFINIKRILFYKKFLKLFFITFVIILVFIISLIINQKSFFSVNPLKLLLIRIILDINFIIFLNKYLGKTLKEKYINFFKGYIYSSCIDVFLGLLRFKFNIIDEFFIQIFPLRDETIAGILSQKVRLMGVGGYFFGGGIILSISLILITHLLINENLSKKENLKLKMIYCINSILGILISRTTILGLILSCFYFLWNKKNKFIFFNKILINFFILCGIGICLYLNLNSGVQEKIYKFLYTQGIGSVKNMLKMYQILPTNIKTFLIGDAVWENSDKSYYMHIDIGYLRMLFFNGIVGVILKIFFNYNLMKVKLKKLKKLSITFFILYLLLNLKGDILYLNISLYIYIISIVEIKKKG